MPPKQHLWLHIYSSAQERNKNGIIVFILSITREPIKKIAVFEKEKDLQPLQFRRGR